MINRILQMSLHRERERKIEGGGGREDGINSRL